ncbi:MAG: DUF91 domain-containing protein [Sedimentisphaerales bacterium]|nr:DUF91 domain-containing protein [Sedimentisphaerales bacterium]
MKLKLSDFHKLYKSTKKHWYIFPRAQYFNKDNLKELHTVLKFFKREQYIKVKDLPQPELFSDLDPNDSVLREWDISTQKRIQKQMIKKGIIKPRAQQRQTLADHLANIRNHYNLFKKLGFAYFNKHHHLFVSKSGEQFLTAKASEWGEILENQIIKLQFWNPSLEPHFLKSYTEFRIFPYLLTLKLILSLTKKYIDVNEFALFVTPLQNDANINEVKILIENFRKLPQKIRRKVVKSAKISMPHIANASVTLGVFGCTPTLTFKNNKLSIKNKERAFFFVDKIYPKMKFIDYVKFEDWFKYMGDTTFEIPNKDIMEYYVDMGESNKAKEVVSFTDDVDEQTSLKETLEKLFRERLLEEALERNPSAVEKGLRLVKNGRQFSTDVSNIDLLMLDQNSNYTVVELKKGKTEDDVVGQTLRYMGWVKENLSKTKFVRGVIVVGKGEITNKLEMAIKGLQTSQHLIKLKEVRIDIDNIRDVNL